MEKPFGWCFIGAGALAEKVAKVICASGRHRIISVYTRRSERARAFADRFGAEPLDTAQDAVSAPGVDGVYIVTPHNSHFEYAERALLSGKPVLCEKPFTVNSAQARRLVELSETKGVYIAEAMWTWFSPVARQVKAWLDAGEYGQIDRVRAGFHINIKNSIPRISDPMRAGGALLDIGVYPLTYLYRLFGKPEKIECKGILSGGVDLKEDVTLTFKGGLVATASASVADFRGLERFVLTGRSAKTSIFFFHNAKKAKLIRRIGKNETVRTSENGYLTEFDLVAKEIREGRTQSRYVPLEATLDVMEILDECRRQMGLKYPFEI